MISTAGLPPPRVSSTGKGARAAKVRLPGPEVTGEKGAFRFSLLLGRQLLLFFNVEVARVATGRTFNTYSRNFWKGSPDLLQNENTKALEGGWPKFRNII